MTDNLIKQARTYAKAKIFDDTKQNVGYALLLACDLKDMGHFVELDMSDWVMTMKRLTKVVLDTEKHQLKEEDGVTTFSTADRLKFMNDWRQENYDKLVFELGSSGDNFQFLNGVMFATSASKHSVPMLQNVIQADAAHMNFGKYTLYSAYGN